MENNDNVVESNLSSVGTPLYENKIVGYYMGTPGRGRTPARGKVDKL